MLLIKFQFLIEKIDAEILVKLQKEILIFNKNQEVELVKRDNPRFR